MFFPLRTRAASLEGSNIFSFTTYGRCFFLTLKCANASVLQILNLSYLPNRRWLLSDGVSGGFLTHGIISMRDAILYIP